MKKLNKILNLTKEYHELKNEQSWLDCNLEVHFGCDCGCGGDSYTEEEWDEMCARDKEIEKECSEIEKEIEVLLETTRQKEGKC